jgi:hypothetical protein
MGVLPKSYLRDSVSGAIMNIFGPNFPSEEVVLSPGACTLGLIAGNGNASRGNATVAAVWQACLISISERKKHAASPVASMTVCEW